MSIPQLSRPKKTAEHLFNLRDSVLRDNEHTAPRKGIPGDGILLLVASFPLTREHVYSDWSNLLDFVAVDAEVVSDENTSTFDLPSDLQYSEPQCSDPVSHEIGVVDSD